jgi:two-component sensor histidine kinase
LIEWTIEPSAQGDRLILTPGDRLILKWNEKGGPTVSPPMRKGFGSRMIEHGLALELEGLAHLDYAPEGLVCTMNFPASKVVHHG